MQKQQKIVIDNRDELADLKAGDEVKLDRQYIHEAFPGSLAYAETWTKSE